MKMKDKKYRIGKRGEEIAASFLKQKGYQILERNFYTRQGEIDIIAKEKQEYVFVEVKTRTNNQYGEPIEAINQKKIFHLKGAIRYYLYCHQLENKNIRIDVIEVKYQNNKIYLHHIKQAIKE